MRDGHQHIGRRWTDGILPATIIYRIIGGEWMIYTEMLPRRRISL
jgi:hypothetical protein